MDEVKISLASETAGQQGLTNVTFEVANVNDWQDGPVYDFV
jgi:hypothetical protein